MRILSKVWLRWLRFAEIIGNVQMIILLFLLYWTMLAIVAIPFKLLSDPLSLKSPRKGGWVRRPPIPKVLESMRKQG